MDDPGKAISAIAVIVLEDSKRAGRLRGTYGGICSDPWHRWTTEIGVEADVIRVLFHVLVNDQTT